MDRLWKSYRTASIPRAQNLLMTLWPISDEVTVQIMSDFYETG